MPQPAPRHTTRRHASALAISPARVPLVTCGVSTWCDGGEHGRTEGEDV